ncbi:MAG TPA: M3 family oligoendopeptidase [Bacteroidia bacterium]|jgi:oligoendopeptidase F|nr:M3 family oligoendopeptidase [Bacteroidia bacterium]
MIASPKTNRNYLPSNFDIKSWDDLESIYSELLNREINSAPELETWMLDVNELDAAISENYGWRYIKMSCDTENAELVKSYEFFVTEIEPKMAPLSDQLNKKLINSPFVKKLDQKKYFIYLRSVKNSIELFRENNVELHSQISTKSQQYASITGKQTITYEGKELTLQQAALYFKNQDRKIREEVYSIIQKRKDKDEAVLNKLFEELLALRHQVALNAGFKNYRDYKFKELGRFDYNKEDCFNFHESVKKYFVPLSRKIDEERKKKLNLENYKPWDTEVDTGNNSALHPFTEAKELLEKSIDCFNVTDKYFGECLSTMQKMHHLDLESRKGKAPGGYNYPLYESGVPFIFMNAVGMQRDVVTMVHEGGHAVHAFLTKDYKINEFKSVPSEVAELASMSMELISMQRWDVFYKDAKDLQRAKKEQLEKIIKTLCWIACVDAFQQKIYEKPDQTTAERYATWEEIYHQYESGVIDYKGLESSVKRMWHGQLHIFEVPFYYIEYGFAQLGALAVWKNYLHNSTQALQQYKDALSLGYTVSIPEVYNAAGIKFDFSDKYISSIAEFVWKELEQLK